MMEMTMSEMREFVRYHPDLSIEVMLHGYRGMCIGSSLGVYLTERKTLVACMEAIADLEKWTDNQRKVIPRL